MNSPVHFGGFAGQININLSHLSSIGRSLAQLHGSKERRRKVVLNQNENSGNVAGEKMTLSTLPERTNSLRKQ